MTSRLRQPVLVAGVVAAALLALRAVAPLVSPPRSAVAEVASSRPAVAAVNRPAELAEATGASLLLGGEDGLFRVDVDARSVRPIPLPGRRFEADRGLIRRGGTVVAVHGGTAWTTTGEPGRPPTRLGPAAYALAATDPRRAWLVEETGDPERWFRVREVEIGRSRRHPGGWPAAACRSASGRWPGRPAGCSWTLSGRKAAWPSGTRGPGACGSGSAPRRR